MWKVLTGKGRMLEKKAVKGPKAQRKVGGLRGDAPAPSPRQQPAWTRGPPRYTCPLAGAKAGRAPMSGRCGQTLESLACGAMARRSRSRGRGGKRRVSVSVAETAPSPRSERGEEIRRRPAPQPTDPVGQELAPGHRVSRPQGTGSVGDSVGEG